jgi:hypothetical protein
MQRASLFASAIVASVAVAPVHADSGRRELVVEPPEAFRPSGSVPSPYIYVNRCVGGCVVTGGSANDATMQHSSIPPAGIYMLHEFANPLGSLGSSGNCSGGSHDSTACTDDTPCIGDTCNLTAGTCHANASVMCASDEQCNGTCDTADGEWATMMQCMREVYSPFAVTVTDQLPVGVSYTEAMVAGNPAELAQANDVLGIAPFAGDCSAQDNVISFTFANHHVGGGATRAIEICWTAAQESAHAFGLDHEFQFVSAYPLNDNSACMDPMTYRTDCGGEKFFRNADAKCGEYAARKCRCTTTQNSYAKLLDVFGPGTSIVPPPTAQIVMTPNPHPGAEFPVFAQAGSKRGLASVELWLNGYRWESVVGGVFGPDGQPDPSNYSLTAPASVPDGIIDIQIKAYDDLGIEGDSATVTVEKGAPCTSADACATGQHCSTGRCAWDTPVGQIGEDCPYPQYCVSGVCSPTSHPYCSQSCTVGTAQACPSGWECARITGTNGYCAPASGGCCSVHDGRGGWRQGLFAALVLGAVLRRRPRAT